MPPQQAYGLLDFVDYILDFVTHSSILYVRAEKFCP